MTALNPSTAGGTLTPEQTAALSRIMAPQYKVGDWIPLWGGPLSHQPIQAGQAITLDRIRTTLFVLPISVSLSHLATRCNAGAASAVAKFGLFDYSEETRQPTIRLGVTADIDCSAAGLVQPALLANVNIDAFKTYVAAAHSSNSAIAFDGLSITSPATQVLRPQSDFSKSHNTLAGEVGQQLQYIYTYASGMPTDMGLASVANDSHSGGTVNSPALWGKIAALR